MNFIRKSIVIGVSLLAANSAYAQLGGLGGSVGSLLGGNKSAGASMDIGGDVNSFLTKSVRLSELTAISLFTINAAFQNDTALAESRAKMDQLNKVTDPKERQAQLTKLYESASAETRRLMESGQLERDMGALDSEKKKRIGQALLNFGIGSLQAVDLAKTGQGLVQKVAASPIDLPKVVPVKDALPLLGKVASDAGGFMTGLLKVAKGANISVPAVKADSKPVDMTAF